MHRFMNALVRIATHQRKWLAAILLVAFVSSQTLVQQHVHAELEPYCSVCAVPDQSPTIGSVGVPVPVVQPCLNLEAELCPTALRSHTQAYYSRAPPVYQHSR